jgi:hypothetical protein
MGDSAAYYSESGAVEQVEEEVDENYDPTDFLHNLGQPQEAAEADHQPIDGNAAQVPTFEVSLWTAENF